MSRLRKAIKKRKQLGIISDTLPEPPVNFRTFYSNYKTTEKDNLTYGMSERYKEHLTTPINAFCDELSNSKDYSHTQDLNVIPVNKIRSKMEPIYFLDRIIINKFAGAYLGTMFSSNNLHFRKYIMKQCFALDQLRSSL